MKAELVPLLYLLAITAPAVHSLIIPDELPSILSVIYSNIPTIKKGTDSRIGWGFRLGDRADFQVLVELGPQQYTQKLANQGDDDDKNKRNALNGLADELYARRQGEKKRRQQQKRVEGGSGEEEVKGKGTDGSKWLRDWAKNVGNNEENEATVVYKGKPGLGVGEIDAKSVLPDDSVLEKQEEIRRLLKALRQIQAEKQNDSKIQKSKS